MGKTMNRVVYENEFLKRVERFAEANTLCKVRVFYIIMHVPITVVQHWLVLHRVWVSKKMFLSFSDKKLKVRHFQQVADK